MDKFTEYKLSVVNELGHDVENYHKKIHIYFYQNNWWIMFDDKFAKAYKLNKNRKDIQEIPIHARKYKTQNTYS